MGTAPHHSVTDLNNGGSLASNTGKLVRVDKGAVVTSIPAQRGKVTTAPP
jgi:hypothetical protein